MTEGLSKAAMGKFFGKDSSRNQKIYRRFCEYLDLAGLEIDQAVRLLLSRFKLPGEAQQIERLVDSFSQIYYRDNPGVFDNYEVGFLLCYSIIQLHTDAHSDKIKAKDKMSEEQFIRINRQIHTMLSEEYLRGIYQRVTATRFQVGQDRMEHLYDRITFGEFDKQVDEQEIQRLAQILYDGHVFLKYCRKGGPRQRRVFVREGRVYWCAVEQGYRQEETRSFPIRDVTDIYLGCTSTQVMRNSKVPLELDSICFSLQTNSRTLDLKSRDTDIRTTWVKYFKATITGRNREMPLNPYDTTRRVEQNEIDDIWKIDIFPNWEQHWDYQHTRPKQIQKYRKIIHQQNSRSFISTCKKAFKSFKNCFVPQQKYEFQDFNDMEMICGNRSLLLVILWRKGLPGWVRQTLWPLAVGNALEITPSLYLKLKIQIENRDKHHPIEQYLAKHPGDHNKTTLILHALCLYRPELFFSDGIGRLAMTVSQHIDQDDTAFQVLANLTHRYHFLPFFRGNRREIQWRVEYVDSLFKQKVPLLYHQFQELGLTTDMFVVDWLLGLFDRVFISPWHGRFWDCFLLEGEVYCIKSALGILKYFEFDLKMCNLDDALVLLKSLADKKEFNPDQLLSIIDQIQIPYGEYEAYLHKQQIARVNTQIHQTLLQGI